MLLKFHWIFFFSGKIVSPKWKTFKGLKLLQRDKIRLNNAIWRAWYLQCKYWNRVNSEVYSQGIFFLQGVHVLDEFWSESLFSVHYCELQVIACTAEHHIVCSVWLWSPWTLSSCLWMYSLRYLSISQSVKKYICLPLKWQLHSEFCFCFILCTDVEKRQNPVCSFVTPLEYSDIEQHRKPEVSKAFMAQRYQTNQYNDDVT